MIASPAYPWGRRGAEILALLVLALGLAGLLRPVPFGPAAEEMRPSALPAVAGLRPQAGTRVVRAGNESSALVATSVLDRDIVVTATHGAALLDFSGSARLELEGATRLEVGQQRARLQGGSLHAVFQRGGDFDLYFGPALLLLGSQRLSFLEESGWYPGKTSLEVAGAPTPPEVAGAPTPPVATESSGSAAEKDDTIEATLSFKPDSGESRILLYQGRVLVRQVRDGRGLSLQGGEKAHFLGHLAAATVKPLLPAPELRHPENGAAFAPGGEILLRCVEVPGAAAYRFELRRAGDVEPTWQVFSAREPQWRLPTEKRTGAWTWRARAVDDEGDAGPAAPARSLEVRAEEAPPVRDLRWEAVP